MGKYPRTLNLVRPNTANTLHSYRLVPAKAHVVPASLAHEGVFDNRAAWAIPAVRTLQASQAPKGGNLKH
jgi:hypothetical protein